MGRQMAQLSIDEYLQDALCEVRWHEDAIDASALMDLQSGRITRASILPRPRQDPPAQQSVITVADFVEHIFVPEHVAAKRLSGRAHYQAILRHVLTPEEVDRVFRVDVGKSQRTLKTVPNWPYLSTKRLCDVRPEDVQRLVSAALAHGYSTQTVKHIRNVVGAVFAHAQNTGCFTGNNPASRVGLPEMIRKKAHTLTLAQAKEVLGAMRYPEKEMTLISILTGMNVTEICGLQWKRVNVSEEWSVVDGEAVAPRTIAVRVRWHRGELDSVANKRRKRDLPIPEPLLPVLLGLRQREKFTGLDDFVLVSRTGTPLDEHNVGPRRLKRVGKDLELPWLSWQVLRRTHTTLAHELGMQLLGNRVV